MYLDVLLKIAPKQRRVQIRERSQLSLHRDSKPCLTVNLMLRANTEATSRIAARAGVQWTRSLRPQRLKWVKLGRTQWEKMFSALPSNSDIAR
jgi:hypothetical protein